ncbi:MAG: hypothetical protein R3E32_14410 [Chitinophagales bacterium]
MMPVHKQFNYLAGIISYLQPQILVGKQKDYTAILDENGEFIRERNQIIPCLHTIQTPLLPLGNDEFLAGAMRCDSNIDNYFSPYLMRFNSMGDTLWSKQLTPSNIIADNVYPRDLKKTSDGGYLMTGHADHTIGRCNSLRLDCQNGLFGEYLLGVGL